MSTRDMSGRSHRPGWHGLGYPLLLVNAALVLVTVSEGVLLSIVPSTAAGIGQLLHISPGSLNWIHRREPELGARVWLRRQSMEVSMASSDATSNTSTPGPDVDSLAQLLHETAEHHGAFEAVAPPHDWWDWYAAYMRARQAGGTPDEAAATAGRYMAEVKHVVVPPS